MKFGKKQRINRHLSLATSSALGLSLITLGTVTAPVAQAADAPLVDPTINNGNGVLYLQKLTLPYTTDPPTPANGKQNTSLPNGTNAAVGGVEFTIYQVLDPGGSGEATNGGFDLTSPAGWTDATALTAEVGSSPTFEALVAAGAITTDSAIYTCQTGLFYGDVANQSGICYTSASPFTPLQVPLGVYFVMETYAPPGYSAAPEVEKGFLVTLPLADPTSGGSTCGASGTDLCGPTKWIQDNTGTWVPVGTYAAWVYPKNSQVFPYKTSNSATPNQYGWDVNYTINSTIPHGDNSDGQVEVDSYMIEDYMLQQDQNVSVELYDPLHGVVTPLNQGYTYQTQYTGDDYDYLVESVEEPDNPGVYTTAVVFSTRGLAALAAAAQSDVNQGISEYNGTEVIINFDVQYNSSSYPQGSYGYGGVQNIANLDTGDSTTPTNPVLDLFGELNGVKVDSRNSAITLAGAQFQIYNVEPSTAGATPIYAIDANGDNTNVFTTDADGNLSIQGLWYFNWGNGYTQALPTCAMVPTSTGAYTAVYGAAAINPSPASLIVNGQNLLAYPGSAYWLVETGAPAGYNLQVASTEVCITQVNDADSNLVYTPVAPVQLPNVPINAGWSLPLTGKLLQSQYLTRLGYAIMIAGVGVYLIQSRKPTRELSFA